MHFRFHQKPKATQTVKLTPVIELPLPVRYTDVDPSNEPNRPHISSDTINVKERRSQNPKRQNQPRAPKLPSASRPIYPQILTRISLSSTATSFRPVPSAASLRRREGGSTVCCGGPQVLFSQTSQFFRLSIFWRVFKGLAQFGCVRTPLWETFCPAFPRGNPYILRYPQTCPQTRCDAAQVRARDRRKSPPARADSWQRFTPNPASWRQTRVRNFQIARFACAESSTLPTNAATRVRRVRAA
jgi:hypothetical protein